jgi:thiaminase
LTVILFMQSSMASKLSQHLLGLEPEKLRAATEHPFLLHAATGSLPEKAFKAWLTQDRLYALSYLTFISSLLAKVPIPTTSDRQSTLRWRIASALIDCLGNIREELALFEKVAKEHGWTEELGNARPNIQTQAYKDLFAGAGQPTSSLLRGLVTLWATEKCYLLAWSYAASKLPDTARNDSVQQDVMQSTFIPNFSNEDFSRFVQQLEDLVDELGEEAGPVDVQEVEEAWVQVLWAEESFWPESA